MTPRTSIFWKAVCTSFSQFFPAKSRLPILLHGRAAIFTWKKAVEFIRNNYSNEILVSDIARYVCINRSYLYTLFQKYLHTSPQNYLSSCRITRALELLSYTDLSIETVAFYLWLPECPKFLPKPSPEAGHDAKCLSEKVPP